MYVCAQISFRAPLGQNRKRAHAQAARSSDSAIKKTLHSYCQGLSNVPVPDNKNVTFHCPWFLRNELTVGSQAVCMPRNSSSSKKDSVSVCVFTHACMYVCAAISCCAPLGRNRKRAHAQAAGSSDSVIKKHSITIVRHRIAAETAQRAEVEWQMSATLSTYARCSSLPQRAQAYKRRSLRDLVALRVAAHGGYARAIQRVCGDSHVQRARRKRTFIRPHAHTEKKNGPF